MRRSDREVTGSSETDEIIRKADVCRIAMANDNMPYIVTLNFGYISKPGILYFHCAKEGKKLEMIKRNNLVCFEMDTDHNLYRGEKPCSWGMTFSSVVGYGRISIIEDDEKIAGLNSIMAHYGRTDDLNYDSKTLEQTNILRLDISEMTCKRKV